MNKKAISVALAVCCVVAMADQTRIERRKPLTANVGVVSVGLDTYWKQRSTENEGSELIDTVELIQ